MIAWMHTPSGGHGGLHVHLCRCGVGPDMDALHAFFLLVYEYVRAHNIESPVVLCCSRLVYVIVSSEHLGFFGVAGQAGSADEGTILSTYMPSSGIWSFVTRAINASASFSRRSSFSCRASWSTCAYQCTYVSVHILVRVRVCENAYCAFCATLLYTCFWRRSSSASCFSCLQQSSYDMATIARITLIR